MRSKSKLFSLSMTALLVACTAPAGWAAADVCTIIPSSSSTYDTSIAVASNFYGPAQAMVTNFEATTAGTGKAIRICQNSTTTLETEISNYPTRFSLFFAADNSPYSLYKDYSPIPFRYAYGVPVLFGYTSNATNLLSPANVSALMSGVGTGSTYTVSTAPANYGSLYSLQTSAEPLAMADPSLAPYGKAAQTILTNMTGTTVADGSIPSWVVNPAGSGNLYANISLTFNAVGTTSTTSDIPASTAIPSGFVSKAQICSILSDVAYVEFTNTAIKTDQWAAVLNSDTVGTALYDYIQAQMSNGGWNTFLTAECYGTI
jgi:ABC-type molybdate transport system substrate-binding protein